MVQPPAALPPLPTLYLMSPPDPLIAPAVPKRTRPVLLELVVPELNVSLPEDPESPLFEELMLKLPLLD